MALVERFGDIGLDERGRKLLATQARLLPSGQNHQPVSQDCERKAHHDLSAALEITQLYC
jgi:hypothetical protein